MVRTLTMLLALAWCFSPVNHATKIIHDHHKLFIRPHLDYVDIIFDQANNFNLCSEIETCQYNAALAITCDMTGSLKETLYQKLGLEYLSLQRWFLPCKFYKIVKVKSSGYLYQFTLIVPT